MHNQAPVVLLKSGGDMADSKAGSWVERKASVEQQYIERGISLHQTAHYESVHAVVGIMLGCTINCISVDPIIIE